MPSRSFEQGIQDILEMMAEIKFFTLDLTYKEFCLDNRTVRAVLYDLAIIGEIAASLLPDVETQYPQIPWKWIRGLRNIVIHEYFRVNLEIVWETIQNDLPPLADQLRQTLNPQISDHDEKT